MNYIPRHLEPKIKSYLEQFPVLLLTGARQTGKSTLLKHLFKTRDWQYVNLDERGLLAQINSDPDLFVKDINSHVIIDEAQKAPELFHSIKWKVDEGLKHKIILSGSANFQLLHKVTETLAGRAGILKLFPFSINEKYGGKNILNVLLSSKNLEQLMNELLALKPLDEKLIFDHILWGGFPKISEYRDSTAKITWFENYRTTYIERDLRYLSQVADLTDFQKFYQNISFQVGNLLNLSAMANDIGLTVPTCKKYFQILEASYQYFLLRPYYANLHKRLVKSPKVFMWDNGLSNYFLGLNSLQQLKTSSFYGRILENGVIVDLFKQNSLLFKKNLMYFWRTSNGAEIDLIIETEDGLIPIEVKSGVKITPASISALSDFLQLKLPKQALFGIVFYRGDHILRLTKNIIAVPLGYL